MTIFIFLSVGIQFKPFWLRIHSDWKFRIELDWILVRIKNLGLIWIERDWFLPNYIKRDWTILLDWLAWVRIGANTDFEMNRDKSDWFGMNFNPKLQQGKIVISSNLEKLSEKSSISNFSAPSQDGYFVTIEVKSILSFWNCILTYGNSQNFFKYEKQFEIVVTHLTYTLKRHFAVQKLWLEKKYMHSTDNFEQENFVQGDIIREINDRVICCQLNIK